MNPLIWILVGESALAVAILAVGLAFAQRRRNRKRMAALEKLLDNVVGGEQRRIEELRERLEALYGFGAEEAERASAAIFAEEKEFLRELVKTLADADMAGLATLHQPLAHLVDRQIAALSEARAALPMSGDWFAQEGGLPEGGLDAEAEVPPGMSPLESFMLGDRDLLPMGDDLAGNPEADSVPEALADPWPDAETASSEVVPEQPEVTDDADAILAAWQDNAVDEAPEAENDPPAESESESLDDADAILAAWQSNAAYDVPEAAEEPPAESTPEPEPLDEADAILAAWQVRATDEAPEAEPPAESAPEPEPLDEADAILAAWRANATDDAPDAEDEQFMPASDPGEPALLPSETSPAAPEPLSLEETALLLSTWENVMAEAPPETSAQPGPSPEAADGAAEKKLPSRRKPRKKADSGED